jgi:hypothetical protein
MKRSSGITAVAVAAIIEGVFSCVLGLYGLVLIRRMLSHMDDASREVAAAASQAGLEVFILFGVGVFVILSARRLLQLQNWARISLSILGAIFAVLNLFGGYGAVMLSQMSLPPPPLQSLTPIMGWVTGALCLIQAAVGVWWLAFLNRRGVKDQFRGPAAATEITPREPPAGF